MKPKLRAVTTDQMQPRGPWREVPGVGEEMTGDATPSWKDYRGRGVALLLALICLLPRTLSSTDTVCNDLLAHFTEAA